MNLSQVTHLEHLAQYFDSLIELDNDDVLFASSYLRGFIEVAAVQFGDDSQPLTAQLAHLVSEQLTAASHELNESDRLIVDDFWLQLKGAFSH
ncbi:YfcL family protein [Thalassotalea maritima]|uniref:YfcL family protein n=1 Tax=Thalassotalea maritima TaxID=3242416 RepID=UPI003526D26D